MNLNMSLSERNKRILLIIGAVVLCVFVASVVYFALRTIAPKSNSYTTEQSSENNGDNLTAEEQLVKDADDAFKAGQDAFNAGNSEEAIAKLNDAKKLYEQANDTMKAEQTTDYMSFVEQETTVEEEQQKREASPDDTKATSQP